MRKIIALILFFTITIACQKNITDNSEKQIKTDFSSIELKVERGAFHYDSFILKDTIITFYPEKEMDSIEYKQYYTISSQSISKAVRDTLIQKIIDANIWNLKDKYTPEESCTSTLSVSFNLNGKTKKIICDDYLRGCPEIIKYIETKIVQLHNKKLKRIFLPG